MKKIMLVFGTRPEGIKMCPLVNELKRRPQVQTVVCVTGQHKQMLQQVLDAFSVVPDYDLAIMQPNQTLFDVTTAILTRIQAVLNQEKPDLTLVHGDTSTAFVTALACFYLHIPVGHVEAGLRTYNLESPFPEEFNRQAVSLICRYHFAPTEKAKQNLLREGKDESSIFVTGNTSIDALKTTVRADYTHPELTWAQGSRLILITAHRRENLGEAMHHMFRAIRRVLTEHPDVKALYPIHLNPVVRQEAAEELSGLERLHIIEPLDVLDFHNIMAHSTDSGPIPTVFRRKRPVWASLFWSCATRPSARKALRRARSSSSARRKRRFTASLRVCWMTRRLTRRWRTPAIPTATDTPVSGLRIFCVNKPRWAHIQSSSKHGEERSA